MSITKFFLIATSVFTISSTTKANLDVYFADSGQYHDVHLIHEHDPSNILFKISNNEIGIQIPTSSYDFNELQNFANNIHQYGDPALRAEFVEMFNKSSMSRLSPFTIVIANFHYDFAKFDAAGKAIPDYREKFEAMPEAPFTSQFSANVLLNELSRLLEQFTLQHPEKVH